ncbi:MAG TPA: HlyD family secretion protein [Acetobacteraceae bacterium]
MTLAPLMGRMAVTLLVAVVAAGIGWQLWVYYMEAPWTRDGTVRADVVKVAPDVSGLVSDVLVADNQVVHKRQVLFHIDPVRFQLALQLAEVSVTAKQAAAQEAAREANRYRDLTNLEVSTEEKQQSQAKAVEAAAAYQLAVVDRNVAQLNLDRSEVRASVDGIVTNFSMRPGDYVTAGVAVFALVDTGSIYVEGYFDETKLPQIQEGNRARVRLMGESQLIEGHVQSISGGIADRQRQASSDMLANVTPTFSWVRLAQRVPVRIALDHVPPGVRLLAGRTASVEVLVNEPRRASSP